MSGIDPMAPPSNAAEAAKALESFFLRWTLSQVRPEGEGISGGGFAGGVFQEMFEDSLADKLAEAGGLGLASQLERSLSGVDLAEEAPDSLAHATAAPLPVSASAATRAYQSVTGVEGEDLR